MKKSYKFYVALLELEVQDEHISKWLYANAERFITEYDEQHTASERVDEYVARRPYGTIPEQPTDSTSYANMQGAKPTKRI